jgi:hypothetical protein
VFKYGTKFDYFLIVVCCVTSIGSGIAIPLMNIVFGSCRPHPDVLSGANHVAGELASTFTDYFMEGTTVTQQEFQAEINRLSLFIVYLFIGKFVLSYLAMVRTRWAFKRLWTHMQDSFQFALVVYGFLLRFAWPTYARSSPSQSV